MNFEVGQWLWLALGAVLVGLAKTGVPGPGMLAIAVFAQAMPTKVSTGFVLPLLIVGDLVAVAIYRQHAQWKHLWRLFPWTALGVVTGWATLGRMDDDQATRLIGAMICAMVAMQLWRRRSLGGVENLDWWFAALMGVLAGFATLVANAAGPLMAVYLLAMRLPKLQFVGTAAVFYLLLNFFKVPFMAGLGLITGESLRANLALVPWVLAGAWGGRQLLGRINPRLFENLALGLSGLAGLKLLF